MPRGAPQASLVTAVPSDGWHAFVSSNVIGGNYRPYDDGSGKGTLWIAFGGPKKPTVYYAYSGVPEAVWDGLLAAGSKGTYHHQVIRSAFPYAGPLSR